MYLFIFMILRREFSFLSFSSFGFIYVFIYFYNSTARIFFSYCSNDWCRYVAMHPALLEIIKCKLFNYSVSNSTKSGEILCATWEGPVMAICILSCVYSNDDWKLNFQTTFHWKSSASNSYEKICLEFKASTDLASTKDVSLFI